MVDSDFDVADMLGRAHIVPVLTITELAQAVPLARALCAGGLPILEVTLRTPAALDAARAILAEVPEATVGLGPLLSPRDVDDAVRSEERTPKLQSIMRIPHAVFCLKKKTYKHTD